MASILETAVPATATPALARALPYAQSATSFLISAFATLARAILASLAFAGRIVAHPVAILSPFPVLLYILSPAIVFVQIVLEAFVYSPYRLIVYLSDAFYPIYVFLGVACITGALLGLSGRGVVWVLLLLVPPPSSPQLVDAEEKKPRRIR
ncbi:hypothetical protein DFH06DRAFT_1248249 [Mycena polygramma]|nr:hypothetical protein DFH06DRAFT_1248249 [Mycena polygramma]